MRSFVVALGVVAGCYGPSYKDCEITCATNNHACPDGFSCDMNLGVCREHGVETACGVTASDSGVDAQQCFGFTLATNFDPCVVRDSNGDTTIDTLVIYNTDSGMIVGNPLPGFDTGTMVEQPQGPRIRALRFGDLYIAPAGVLQITGVTPLLFVVHTARIEGAIDLNSTIVSPGVGCTATEGATAGSSSGGGGGGGNGAMGGAGGQAGVGASTGMAMGGAMIAGGFSPLHVSCPGRRGAATANATAGSAGAAGGAVQITARDSITVSGSIRANGGGGGGGAPTANCSAATPCAAGGGGGGAGGVVLLEAPTVTIGTTGKLCANGGGGGGGAGTMQGQASPGSGGGLLCAATPPSGGQGATGGGMGGIGGYVTSPAGRTGTDGDVITSTNAGGGGGGAVGRIGVHATTPMVMPSFASPAVEMLP